MKLYIYTNQNGFDETVRVPLVLCKNEFLPESVTKMDYFGKYYCPDFGEDHILLNNYYYADYAWMRWTIERC